MTIIEKGKDPSFEEIQFAITTLLRAMAAQGAPSGSAGMFNPDGVDVCVIVATGQAADDFAKLHEIWEEAR